jgi:hypothetical protein
MNRSNSTHAGLIQGLAFGCRIITTSGTSKSWDNPHRELQDSKIDLTRLSDREYELFCVNLRER